MTTSGQVVPDSAKDTAYYTKEKAAAEARLATINADAAAQKAQYSNLPTSGLSGSTTVGTGAGNSEATLLSAKALATAAKQIADEIDKEIGGVDVVLVAGLQRVSVDNWQAFKIQRDLVVLSYMRANNALIAATKCVTDTPQAEASLQSLFNRAKNTSVIDPSLFQSAITPAPAVPSKTTGVLSGLIAAGTDVPGVGVALDLASKLASYFQSDYQVAASMVSGVDDGLLATLVAGRLSNRKLHYSALWQGTDHVTRIDALIWPLAKLADEAAGRARDAQTHLDDLRAAGANDPTSSPATSAFDTALAAFSSAQKNFDALIVSLGSPDKDGIPAAVQIAIEHHIAQLLDGGLLLSVKVDSTVGSNYTKKDILSTVFGKIPFYVAGGVIASYMLLEGKTGLIKKSGQALVHGGYVSVDDAPHEINK